VFTVCRRLTILLQSVVSTLLPIKEPFIVMNVSVYLSVYEHISQKASPKSNKMCACWHVTEAWSSTRPKFSFRVNSADDWRAFSFTEFDPRQSDERAELAVRPYFMISGTETSAVVYLHAPPLELWKISHMAKNATLEKLPQLFCVLLLPHPVHECGVCDVVHHCAVLYFASLHKAMKLKFYRLFH